MSVPSPIHRRDFLKGTASAGLLWSPLLAGCAALPIGRSPAAQARNVIFLVADGMNTGTWTIADYYLQHTSQQRTEWVKLYQEREVHRALMETCSSNSHVTDSAAAASAWSSGTRIANGAINYTPEGEALVPIHEQVQGSGRSTGLVTTTRITHATPAAFASCVTARGQEDSIAQQYLDRGVDVLMGGGSKHFDATIRADGVDLKSRYQAAGYHLMESRDQLLSEDSGDARRQLGLFSSSHLPYSIDRQRDAAIAKQVPTLAEMMKRALATLQKNPAGFLLQVEGGRVDHAGHANDVGAIVHDQLAFDECVAVARAFSSENPETLVVVTTDHGCGGCQLNGMGAAYGDTDTTFFSGVEKIGASYEYLQSRMTSPDSEQFQALVGDHLQLTLDAERIRLLGEAKPAGGFAVANLLRKWHESYTRTGVNWTSGNHTGEFVEVSTWGPGSETLPYWIRNTDLNGLLRSSLELS